MYTHAHIIVYLRVSLPQALGGFGGRTETPCDKPQRLLIIMMIMMMIVIIIIQIMICNSINIITTTNISISTTSISMITLNPKP